MHFVQSVPATIDGMLGGFADLTTRDVAASLDFLRPFLSVVSCGMYPILCVPIYLLIIAAIADRIATVFYLLNSCLE